MVNSDHVPLGRTTLVNPVYLRNAMVDLLTRRPVEKEEIPLNTSTEVAQVEQAELVPFAVKKFKPVEVDIDHLADFYKKLIKARADKAQLVAYIATLEARIKAELVDRNATDGRIKNAVVVTYRPKDAFRWAEFTEEHPEIADQYMVRTEVEVLDRDALLKDHRGILEGFRSSAFNIK